MAAFLTSLELALMALWVVVWIDWGRVFFLGARSFLSWRHGLTLEGLPRWPSGRPTVQRHVLARLRGSVPERAPELEDSRQETKTRWRAFYLRGLLLLAIAAAIILVHSLR